MIEKSIFLRCTPDEAFRLFTQRISEWWPTDHRPTKDSESELFIERSGRFWERSRDGREVELGQVLVWDAPNRLAMDFYLGTSALQPTAVEVIFLAENEGTRVTVRHEAKPDSEDLWNQRAVVFAKSWDTVLSALASW